MRWRKIYSAAATFSVLRITLDDRIKGRVKHGISPGLVTALTLEQHGYPLTRTTVSAYGWAIPKKSGN